MLFIAACERQLCRCRRLEYVLLKYHDVKGYHISL